MIASTHLAMGSMGALVFQRYLPPKANKFIWLIIIFLVGVATHVILDLFPHQEYKSNWPWPLIIVETILVLSLVFYGEYKTLNGFGLFVGMAGGAAPDLSGIIFGGVFKSYFSFLHIYHGVVPLNFLISIFWQYVIAGLAIAYIKIKTA